MLCLQKRCKNFPQEVGPKMCCRAINELQAKA